MAYYHARTHAHFYTLDEDFSHTNYVFFFLTRTPPLEKLFFSENDAFPNCSIPGGSACRHQFFSELFPRIQENFPQKIGTILHLPHTLTQIHNPLSRYATTTTSCSMLSGKSGKKNQFSSGDAEFRTPPGRFRTTNAPCAAFHAKTFTHSRLALRERKLGLPRLTEEEKKRESALVRVSCCCCC